MKKYDTATPYAAAYVLVKKDGKYAFVKRANTDWMNGYYGLPSGKVEKDETFLQAAIRESKEEIGIDVQKQDLEYVQVCCRLDGGMYWVDFLFVVRKWEGEPYNAEPHMHSELAWFAIDDLPEDTLPNVRFILEQYQAGITYCEFGWDV